MWTRPFIDDRFDLQSRAFLSLFLSLSYSKVDFSAIKPAKHEGCRYPGRASPPGKCDSGKISSRNLGSSGLCIAPFFARVRTRAAHTHTNGRPAPLCSVRAHPFSLFFSSGTLFPQNASDSGQAARRKRHYATLNSRSRNVSRQRVRRVYCIDLPGKVYSSASFLSIDNFHAECIDVMKLYEDSVT